MFGLNTGKYGPEKTPYLNTFHAVKSLKSKSLVIIAICCLSRVNKLIFLVFLLFPLVVKESRYKQFTPCEGIVLDPVSLHSTRCSL